MARLFSTKNDGGDEQVQRFLATFTARMIYKFPSIKVKVIVCSRCTFLMWVMATAHSSSFPSGRLMMIDINNSKSLPDEDVEALAGESRPVTCELHFQA